MIAPGAHLWLYDGKEAAQTWAKARATALRVRPQGIILHTEPDPEDGAVVDAIRRELPSASISIATGINGLVARTDTAGRLVPRPIDEVLRTVSVWASRCASWGVSGWIANAEGASKAGRPGWKPSQGLSRGDLIVRASELMRAAHSAAPTLALGYSSHDVPDSHAVPHEAFAELASYLVPQEYTAPRQPDDPAAPPVIAGRASAWQRAHLGEPQWRARATSGHIPAALAPGAAGWWPAYQLHHTTADALFALAWRYDLSAWWALTSSCDAAGLEACATVAAAVRAGIPRDVKVLQELVGVDVDGVIGPATYAAVRAYLARTADT